MGKDITVRFVLVYVMGEAAHQEAITDATTALEAGLLHSVAVQRFSLDEIATAQVPRVYLHLDVDVLDPTIGSANGFAVPGGLSVEQILEMITLVRAHVRIVACGVASYDPSYDPQVAILQAGLSLIKALLP